MLLLTIAIGVLLMTRMNQEEEFYSPKVLFGEFTVLTS